MSTENSQATDQHTFAHLAAEKFIQLKTFRKSGEAVPTPVWFASQQGKLYIITQANVGKVKRIRNNGRVMLTPCNQRGVVHGQEVEGIAGELAVAEQAQANDLLAQKYGFMYKAIGLFSKIRKSQRTILEIKPA